LNPAVKIPAADKASARVVPPLTPISPESAKAGREASRLGKEKGVQFPWANARSNRVPSAASVDATGM